MHDEEIADIWKTLEEFGALLAQAQGFNRANNFILMEIVRDVARSQPEPQKYISKMYELVKPPDETRELQQCAVRALSALDRISIRKSLSPWPRWPWPHDDVQSF
jgi:hypothetical protein